MASCEGSRLFHFKSHIIVNGGVGKFSLACATVVGLGPGLPTSPWNRPRLCFLLPI